MKTIEIRQCDRKPATIVHYHRNEKDPLSSATDTAGCASAPLRAGPPAVLCSAVSHDGPPRLRSSAAVQEPGTWRNGGWYGRDKGQWILLLYHD